MYRARGDIVGDTHENLSVGRIGLQEIDALLAHALGHGGKGLFVELARGGVVGTEVRVGAYVGIVAPVSLAVGKEQLLSPGTHLGTLGDVGTLVVAGVDFRNLVGRHVVVTESQHEEMTIYHGEVVGVEDGLEGLALGEVLEVDGEDLVEVDVVALLIYVVAVADVERLTHSGDALQVLAALQLEGALHLLALHVELQQVATVAADVEITVLLSHASGLVVEAHLLEGGPSQRLDLRNGQRLRVGERHIDFAVAAQEAIVGHVTHGAELWQFAYLTTHFVVERHTSVVQSHGTLVDEDGTLEGSFLRARTVAHRIIIVTAGDHQSQCKCAQGAHKKLFHCAF